MSVNVNVNDPNVVREDDKIKLQVAMPLRLYQMSTLKIVLLFASFFLVVGISAIVSSTKNFKFYDNYPQSTNLTFIENSTYTLPTSNLTKLHQEIWLSVTPEKKSFSPGLTFSHLYISVSVKGRNNPGEEWTVLVRESARKKRYIECIDETSLVCKPLVIMHLPFLQYQHFETQVTFEGNENYFGLSNCTFKWTTYHPEFTLFEISFRFSLLLITLVVTLIYGYALKNHPYTLWSVEQKWTLGLLLSLIGFNNPLYPFTISESGWFILFMDILLQGSFLISLMLYWLCVFHGIRIISKQRRFLSFYLPKLILVGLIWFVMIVANTWEHLHQLDDPSYQTAFEIPGFIFFQSVFGILIAFYVFALMFYVFRAAGEMRKLPFLDIRVKFLASITFFSISVCVGGAIANVYFQYDVSTTYFSFYIMFNMYVYLLAFVYSPTIKAPQISRVEFAAMVPLTDDESDQDMFAEDVHEEGLSTNVRFGNTRRTQGGKKRED